MRDRFRTFDSRISFFAFADIITAVSGMLIFITLLLATDLGRPTDARSRSENAETERQLQEILSQQAEVDAQNDRWQGLLAAAEAAPDLDQLEADLERLRLQISQEQKRQAALAAQMTDGQAARAARDQTLGLSDLRAAVERAVREAEVLARQEAKATGEMSGLEQKAARLQRRLLQLREKEGQLWLIPDHAATAKEPVLVTVSGEGATVERFDRPEERRQFGKNDAKAGFKDFLLGVKALNQYMVFYVRPSGVALFQSLVKTARDARFDVGFDALEENRQLHFESPQAVDDSTPPAKAPAATPGGKADASGGASGFPTNAIPTGTSGTAAKPPPAAPPRAATPPKPKSWWQRLLEWVGLRPA